MDTVFKGLIWLPLIMGPVMALMELSAGTTNDVMYQCYAVLALCALSIYFLMKQTETTLAKVILIFAYLSVLSLSSMVINNNTSSSNDTNVMAIAKVTFVIVLAQFVVMIYNKFLKK